MYLHVSQSSYIPIGGTAHGGKGCITLYRLVLMIFIDLVPGRIPGHPAPGGLDERGVIHDHTLGHLGTCAPISMSLHDLTYPSLDIPAPVHPLSDDPVPLEDRRPPHDPLQGPNHALGDSSLINLCLPSILFCPVIIFSPMTLC